MKIADINAIIVHVKKVADALLKKQVLSHYKADVRFAHPNIVTILNKSNPKNNRHVFFYETFAKIKKSKKHKTELYGYKIQIPKDNTNIVIDKKKYMVKDIENLLFNCSGILKHNTIKYRLWLAIKLLEKETSMF